MAYAVALFRSSGLASRWSNTHHRLELRAPVAVAGGHDGRALDAKVFHRPPFGFRPVRIEQGVDPFRGERQGERVAVLVGRAAMAAADVPVNDGGVAGALPRSGKGLPISGGFYTSGAAGPGSNRVPATEFSAYGVLVGGGVYTPGAARPGPWGNPPPGVLVGFGATTAPRALGNRCAPCPPRSPSPSGRRT